MGCWWSGHKMETVTKSFRDVGVRTTYCAKCFRLVAVDIYPLEKDFVEGICSVIERHLIQAERRKA